MKILCANLPDRDRHFDLLLAKESSSATCDDLSLDGISMQFKTRLEKREITSKANLPWEDRMSEKDGIRLAAKDGDVGVKTL